MHGPSDFKIKEHIQAHVARKSNADRMIINFLLSLYILHMSEN